MKPASAGFFMWLPQSTINALQVVYLNKKMPQSKNRKGHKQHHHQHEPQHGKPNTNKSKRTLVVPMIIFATLGLGIGFFINSGSAATWIASTLLGAVAGFIFGKQVEKAAKKKAN